MEENNESVMESPDSELTEIISVNLICRLCANQNDKLIGIFSENGISNDLASKMNLYLPIKVCESDELPLQCCWQCASTVLAWHDLFLTSIEANRRLKSYQFVSEKQLKSIAGYIKTDTEQQNEKYPQLAQEYHKVPEDDPSSFIGPRDTENLSEAENEQEDTSGSFESNCEYLQAVDMSSNCCKLCSQSFANKIELKNHMLTSHNLRQSKLRRKKSEIDALFTCPECQKRFTRKFDMQKHIRNKHPDKSATIGRSTKSKNAEVLKKCKVTDADGSYYACDVCKSKFKKSTSLMRHRNIHFHDKVNYCHICGREFQTPEHLKRHINHLHYDIKQFKCIYCDQSFKSKTTRDEHLNIHTDARPFMCDVCGKAFKQQASLYVHKKFHEDVFPFSCNVCGKKFRRRRELTVHQWVHSGERPHSCDICRKTFRLGQDLKRHRRTHSSYSCGECGLSFDKQKLFKLHKGIHDTKT